MIVKPTLRKIAAIAAAASALVVAACSNDTPAPRPTPSASANQETPSPSPTTVVVPSPLTPTPAQSCDPPENAVSPDYTGPGWTTLRGNPQISSNSITATGAGNSNTAVNWSGPGTDPIPNGYTAEVDATFRSDPTGRTIVALMADGVDGNTVGAGHKGTIFIGTEGGRIWFGVYGARGTGNPLLDTAVTQHGYGALRDDPTSQVVSHPYTPGTPVHIKITTGDNSSVQVSGYPTLVIDAVHTPNVTMYPHVEARGAEPGKATSSVTVGPMTMNKCVTKTVAQTQDQSTSVDFTNVDFSGAGSALAGASR